MTETLEPLAGAGTVLLRTFRRDGRPVATPVSIAFDGDRAFFRSYDKAWKTKRLRNNSSVEVAPSTFRGRATGAAVPAHAMLVTGRDAELAARALARRHPVLQGILVPAAHRLKGYKTVHYELKANEGAVR